MNCKNCNKEIVGVLVEITLNPIKKEVKAYKCLNCGHNINHIEAIKDYTKIRIPKKDKFLIKMSNKTNNSIFESKGI